MKNTVKQKKKGAVQRARCTHAIYPQPSYETRKHEGNGAFAAGIFGTIWMRFLVHFLASKPPNTRPHGLNSNH